jgi:transposase
MIINHDWSAEEIVVTYRSQYIIEDIFKQMVKVTIFDNS